MQEAGLLSAKMKLYALWSEGKRDSTVWNHMKRGANEPTTQLKGLMILQGPLSFFILFSRRLFLCIEEMSYCELQALGSLFFTLNPHLHSSTYLCLLDIKKNLYQHIHVVLNLTGLIAIK